MNPVFTVPRGCPAAESGIGCGCTGRCQEPIEVVRAADYWKAVGERDEARRRSIPSAVLHAESADAPARAARALIWSAERHA